LPDAEAEQPAWPIVLLDAGLYPYVAGTTDGLIGYYEAEFIEDTLQSELWGVNCFAFDSTFSQFELVLDDAKVLVALHLGQPAQPALFNVQAKKAFIALGRQRFWRGWQRVSPEREVEIASWNPERT
jgi:hypothetical protein